MQKSFKLVTVFVLFAIILSSMIIAIQVSYYEQRTVQLALENAIEKTKEREAVLGSYCKESESILTSIRKSSAFNRYLDSEDTKATLSELFLASAESHMHLSQLRFIDAEGNEQIRVDRKSDTSIPQLVTVENLQNKSHRDYVQRSHQLPLEKCWHGAFDLNMEHKKIQMPYVPVFRTMLPIEHEGKYAGILIVNHFAQSFLNRLTNAPLYDLILCDGEGFTITHYDETRSWGFYQTPQYHISQEYPVMYRDILGKEMMINDVFVSKKLNIPIDNGLYMILKINHTFLEEITQQAFQQFIVTGLITLGAFIILGVMIIGMFKKIVFNLETVNKLQDNLNEASKIAKIGFWEMDASTKKVTYNPGIYELLELENKVMDSYRQLASFVIEEDRSLMKKQLYASIAQKRELHVVHEIITAKQNNKIVESKVKHYFDKSGKHTHSIGSLFDITDRKREHEKTMKILDMQENIVIVTDGDKIQYANKKLLAFFGINALEDFFKVHKCICERFIEHENFFHLKKIKKKHHHWIEAILMLSGRERVVSMIDGNGKPTAFAVSINKFDESSYIINFSDISVTSVIRSLKKYSLKKR